MSELGPVFVDPSGRRARLTHAFGALAAGLCGLYLLLVVVALVAAPGVLPLSIPGLGSVLPGPGAPPLSEVTQSPAPPAQVLSRTPSPRPPSSVTTNPAAPRPQPTATRTNPVGRTLPPHSTGSPRPTASPSSTPTPTKPGATHPTGKPTAPPGRT